MGVSTSSDANSSPSFDESPIPVNIMTEESDEEIEAGLEERRRILEDCMMLKQYAAFHLHPERPVAKNPTGSARCYFDRPSAPQQESVEDMKERIRVLEDCVAMRMYAAFSLHPERPVETTNFTSFGRNYFGRPSAIPQISKDEADEKAQALEDAQLFKQFATFHLHPELRVVTKDPVAFGRNYFARASATPQESFEITEERNCILNEVAALKMYARFHLHPELPVKTTDPCAVGRNYFDRASGPEVETLEDIEERDRILQDVEALKKYAKFHLHPELPVKTTDPCAVGRNYFDRASGPEVETLEDIEERDRILQDVEALKKYAKFHLHPELPVTTTDPCAVGRNYFDRASGPEVETLEDIEERDRVLQDVEALKKYAKFHLHPELSVTTTDPCAVGRNYFDRASGPEVETQEAVQEKECVLQDAAQLEDLVQILHTGYKLKHNYFHDGVMKNAPESKSETYETFKLENYSNLHHEVMASESNFFDKISAPMQDSSGNADHDYFHFTMDEDMLHDESEVAEMIVQSGCVVEMKNDDEGNLSRSPSSIFEFA